MVNEFLTCRATIIFGDYYGDRAYVHKDKYGDTGHTMPFIKKFLTYINGERTNISSAKKASTAFIRLAVPDDVYSDDEYELKTGVIGNERYIYLILYNMDDRKWYVTQFPSKEQDNKITQKEGNYLEEEAGVYLLIQEMRER